MPIVGSIAEGKNYTKARWKFAESKDFNAYAVQLIEKALVEKALKAWAEGDAVKTVDLFNEILEIYPLSIEANRRLADTYEVLADSTSRDDQKEQLLKLQEQHMEVVDGVLNSILKSGDGSSTKTAFKVICIPEEYWTMYRLDYEIVSQSLIEKEGKFFDLLEGKDLNGKKAEVYFDVTSFYKPTD